MSKVLTLSNSASIEKELSKIASSKERKQMWIYLDGKRMPKDIADRVKVTPQAVSLFLNVGVTMDLIEYQRGKPPRRLLDYVPPEWLSLVEIVSEPVEANQNTPPASSTSAENTSIRS